MKPHHTRTLLIALLCLTACAKSADEIKRESKRELLSALPEQVIIPGYRNFAAAVASLQQSAARYCAAPEDAARRSLQEQWRAAMTAWQQTSAYAFGPVAQYDLPALINYAAVRKSKLDYWLEPGRLATAEQIKNYSVQGRGLGALEYLLFEPDIARKDPPYCAYLAALTDDLAANADRILRFWQEEARPLSVAAKDDEQDIAVREQLDELLNAALQAMETVKDDKLGLPLGRKNGGVAQPDKVESRLSGHSLQNIRANIVSLQTLVYGGDSAHVPEERITGLASYLRKTGRPEAAAALEQTLRRILEALERIPQPLQPALHEQPQAAETLYREVAALCDILENTVLPAFDVQPGFNAKDGD